MNNEATSVGVWVFCIQYTVISCLFQLNLSSISRLPVPICLHVNFTHNGSWFNSDNGHRARLYPCLALIRKRTTLIVTLSHEGRTCIARDMLTFRSLISKVPTVLCCRYVSFVDTARGEMMSYSGRSAFLYSSMSRGRNISKYTTLAYQKVDVRGFQIAAQIHVQVLAIG